PLGQLGHLLRSVALIAVIQPRMEQSEGVVPQRINLHCLAAPWGHYPVADLGVHPGKLIARGTLAEQAVLWVNADAKVRAPDMMPDDIDELRQQESECLPVACEGHVAGDGMEEPERRVGRVIESILLALWEEVGNEPISNVVGEGVEDVVGLPVPAGVEG